MVSYWSIKICWALLKFILLFYDLIHYFCYQRLLILYLFISLTHCPINFLVIVLFILILLPGSKFCHFKPSLILNLNLNLLVSKYLHHHLFAPFLLFLHFLVFQNSYLFTHLHLYLFKNFSFTKFENHQRFDASS